MTLTKSRWELVTGVVPVLCGAYAFVKNLQAFEYVGYAVAWGFGATIIIVIFNLASLQGVNEREVSRDIEPVFNRLSWSGLAFILFIAAINRFNTVIFDAKLPILEDERCVFGYAVPLIDAGSFSFGILLVGLLVFIPVVTGRGAGRADRKILLTKVYRFWVPVFALLFMASITVVYNLKAPDASHPCPVKAQSIDATDATISAATSTSTPASHQSSDKTETKTEASEAVAIKQKAQSADASYNSSNPFKSANKYDALISLFGLLIFFWGYFKKHPTLAQVLVSRPRKATVGNALKHAVRPNELRGGTDESSPAEVALRESKQAARPAAEAGSTARSPSPSGKAEAAAIPGDRREEGSQKNLRLLVLNLIVLPPIIVGVARVSESMTPVSAAFYGIFIYSGFAVWSLSIKIFSERRGLTQTTALIASQFLISLLLTTLWGTLLAYIEGIDRAAKFHLALVYSLGAILIFINFGAVFATVWEGALADEWLQQNSKFGILAVLICTMLAGIPQRPLAAGSEQLLALEDFIKPALVVAFSILAILAPVVFSSRSVFAHILIRVQPGETMKVLQTLAERDITATVTYGEFDVIAKVEIPGRVRIFRKREETGGRELAQLAALVESLCSFGGIVETQTLLDFTGYVRPQPGGKL